MSLILSGTDGLSDIDGTAATPAIRGTDTNTGIFFPAADTIAFSQGGAEAMRIDSSGNVGIGTSSPGSGSKIDVNGVVTSSSSGKYLNLGWAGSNAYIQATDVSSTAYNLIFYGGAAERARIDTSGNLLVGTATGIEKLTVNGNVSVQGQVLVPGAASTINTNCNGSSYYGIMVKNLSGSNSQAMTFVNSSNSFIGTIVLTNTSTVYNTSSDYRLKHDVQPMTGALEKVAALKPCTYKWNVDGSGGQGFIAHELAEVCPHAVTGEKDAVNDDGSIKPQGIDTSFLVATLTAAIQELKAIVDAQAARITALEGAQP